MHKIYVTEGIVLAKRGMGEANTHVAVFTEELGLVRAVARSARFEKSKLRYGLEPLTRGRFSFVRGKYEWKITGVENISRLYVSATPYGKIAIGRVSRLLLRLIHGEERGKKLYHVVSRGFLFFAGTRTKEEIESTEWVVVLRILSHLGYVPEVPALEPFMKSGDITEALALEAQGSKAFLLRTINTSLAATHL